VQGVLLGNYRILEKLGEGGMGEVYRGRHETLGHPVAVKILRPEMSRNADVVKRFFNEAVAATSIRNPSIIQIYDFGTTPDGSAYFVMELLEGESLMTRLKQRRLGDAECCRLGRQVANALHAAHAAGITHRDLKPDNLFLIADTEVPGGERVKVLDFGIAKLAGDSHEPSMTRTGLVMGTPLYMSPEQCRGAGEVDSRADIYSLGCILFRMVCGRPLFDGHGAGEIIGAHLHLPPPDLRTIAPDVPPQLAALIGQMLAKQPDARPQPMAAVSRALDEILRTLEEPAPRASAPVLQPMPPSTSQPRLPQPQLHPQAHPPSLAQHQPPSLPQPLLRSPLSSTTLSDSAGIVSAGRAPAPASTNRRWFVLGGLVVAGAIIAIVAVVAAGGSEPAKAPISYDDIAASPSTNATAAAMTAQVEAECARHRTAQKWADLARCADQLAPLNAGLAKQLTERAAQEIKAVPRAATIEVALRANDLLRAGAELDQLWADSAVRPKLQAAYDAAETAAIEDAVARLEHVSRGDCKQYNQLLAEEQTFQPPRVAAEAQRQTKCTPAPLRCDADVLAGNGMNAYSSGAYAASLAYYEAAIACRPDPSFVQKAFVVACNLNNLRKAKTHWRRMLFPSRAQALEVCVRNGITEDQLSAP